MCENKPICKLLIRDCHKVSYRAALTLQKRLVIQRQAGKIHNTVLILEHTPVITLGARQSENRLLTDEKALKDKGIELTSVRRGGGVTAHNPGQVVLYPIMDLKSLHLGINEYIRQLEAIGIELLANFEIEAQRRKGFPGLWVNHKKIGSIGVKVKKWVTYHGMAVNIENDLSIFENIVPCGIDNVEMTSAYKETGKTNLMADVKDKLAMLCTEHFSSREIAAHEK